MSWPDAHLLITVAAEYHRSSSGRSLFNLSGRDVLCGLERSFGLEKLPSISAVASDSWVYRDWMKTMTSAFWRPCRSWHPISFGWRPLPP